MSEMNPEKPEKPDETTPPQGVPEGDEPQPEFIGDETTPSRDASEGEPGATER